MTSFAFRILD